MKKLLSSILFLVLSIYCYSQIHFEKGYYINNSNEKVDCFIKNIDWEFNPTEFNYKLHENGEVETIGIKKVKEFGVDSIYKYLRSKVQIERSSERISELSSERKAIFNEEELFLKVLIDGEASLFIYKSGSIIKYFYSVGDLGIEQLVFKSYKEEFDRIGTNNRFRQQLWNHLKCSCITSDNLEILNYTKGDLLKVFVKYNKCNNHDFTNFEEKQKRDWFHLSLRPGLNYSSLSIDNAVSNFKDVDFGNEFSLRFGVEMELILPFNKNKWVILIEPTFQFFESVKELTTQKAIADYKSIELPLGLRHNFFLNEKSNIFLNSSFIIDLSINSFIIYGNAADLEIGSGFNFAFGGGYRYNDKISLELRFQTKRNILPQYPLWFTKYKTVSVIVGYKLF